MSTTTTYPFTTEGNYTFDSSLIEIVEGKAQLKLQDYPSQTIEEDFADDTGFTYDNTKAEFTGGLVRQKDLLPTDSTAWATYTTDVDLSYGGGSITGTAVGATVSGGQLDITGSKYVSYSGTDNFNNAQTGAIRFKLTPKYSGTPAASYYIFSQAKAQGDPDNRMQLISAVSGAITFTVLDQNAVSIMSKVFLWSPIADQTYEFEINYDLAGTTRIFVDGVVKATSTDTGTRSSDIEWFALGTDYTATQDSNFLIEDLIVFDTVQHTTNYTPGYSLLEGRYEEVHIGNPFKYVTTPGQVLSIDGFITTEVGSPKYHFTIENVGSFYYNTIFGAWIPSDGSYTQSNTAAEINSNMSGLGPYAGSIGITFDTVFPASSIQSSVSNWASEYTGQIYPITNPTIVPNSTFRTSDWESISSTTTAVGSDAVKYTVLCGGQDRYVTGGSAANSDGTYTQSSTIAELTSDIGDLITGICSSTAKIFLHSEGGLTTPSIDLLTAIYNLAAISPILVICNLDGYIYDHEGPLANEEIKIRPFAGFLNSTALHKYEWKTLGTTNDAGWFTADIYVQTTGQYWEMKVGKQRYKFQLPDSAEADFSTLDFFEVVRS